MAHVDIETNLWDTDEAIALGVELGDEDAWRFLVRLWAWGIDADRQDGLVKLQPRRLSQVSGWAGDPDRFVAALVSTGWLVPVDGGGYYLRGWSRTKRYFKEKERLRAKSEARRAAYDALSADLPAVRTAVPNAGDTACKTQKARGNPSPSPSHSPSPSPSLSAEITPEGAEHWSVMNRAMAECGLSRPGNDTERKLASLCPIDADVLDKALERTRSADRPNWTYLIKCLASPQSGNSNGKVGYHPGSTTFGEGDQKL